MVKNILVNADLTIAIYVFYGFRKYNKSSFMDQNFLHVVISISFNKFIEHANRKK